MRDFLSEYYTFMRNFLWESYIFMRDFGDFGILVRVNKTILKNRQRQDVLSLSVVLSIARGWPRGYYFSNFLTITVALWPPKPNELDSAARTVRFSALLKVKLSV